jgi:hypothetical protein
VITTVPGKDGSGYFGDGGAATNANLSSPSGVALDVHGNLLIADSGNNRIRILRTNGIIDTVAGSDNQTLGDGGAAIDAGLSAPFGVAVEASGRLFIGDTYDKRIRQVAATAYYGGGQVYTSSNLGASWILRLSMPGAVFGAIASSADGNIIVAGEATSSNQGGLIHISRDAGTTWTNTSAPSQVWSSIACSADGSKLVATVGYGYGSPGPIYTSGDSGLTWTQTSAPSLDWSSVDCSPDGTKIVAAAYDGAIYLSDDSGVTWTSTFAPPHTWSSVVWSGDGNNIVAVSVGGAIYRLQLPLGLHSP